MDENERNAVTFAVLEAAKAEGFECRGSLPAHLLEVDPEVRSMCADNRCRSYNKNWACPPACGTIEEYAKALGALSVCVVVQTAFALEDEFDIEGMQDAERLHKERFDRFASAAKLLRDRAASSPLALAAGACTRCPQCSYPERPCRFPDDAHASMEAAGLIVSATCDAAGIPYYHGKGTIAYTSCLVF
ncbi:DUF2284 domain-containing protein [Gordonibacter sp.]|uniref:DUF2284 domain-containing protein n=1 Tax=Gordonibacter sp. TaxID=1968902 RepID=UPI002FCA999E